jgi:hypothetical protein
MASTTWEWLVIYENGTTEKINSTDDLYEMAERIDEYHGIVSINRIGFAD